MMKTTIFLIIAAQAINLANTTALKVHKGASLSTETTQSLSIPHMHIDGSLRNISINSQGHMWGTDAKNEIYFRDGIKGSWNKIYCKEYTRFISVNEDGNVWNVNPKGKAFIAQLPNGWTPKVQDARNPWWYQFEEPSHPPWLEMAVYATHGDKVFGIQKDTGKVWAQKSNFNRTLWYREKGKNLKEGVLLTNISAGKDARIWGTTSKNAVYYKDTNDTGKFSDWVEDKSIKCRQVSATDDGRVCCNTAENTIYVSDKVGEWTQLDGWRNIGWVGCARGGDICATTNKSVIMCRDREAEIAAAAKIALEEQKREAAARDAARAAAADKAAAIKAAAVKAAAEQAARRAHALWSAMRDAVKRAAAKKAAEAKAAAIKAAADKAAREKALAEKAAAIKRANDAIAQAIADRESAIKAHAIQKAAQAAAAIKEAAAKAAAIKAAREKAAREKAAAEKAAREKAAAVKAAADKAAREAALRAGEIKDAADRAALEKAEKEKAEKIRLAAEKAATERAEKIKADQIKVAADQAAKDLAYRTAGYNCMAKHKNENYSGFRCGEIKGITYYCLEPRTCSQWGWCGANGKGDARYNYPVWKAMKKKCYP